MSKLVSCQQCGRVKKKPKKNRSGFYFCDNKCFQEWRKNNKDLVTVGRPRLELEDMSEFRHVVLFEEPRLTGKNLAKRFKLKQTTAIHRRNLVLTDAGIDIDEYNKSVLSAPRPYKPKMPREFYEQNYHIAFWDFDKQQWNSGLGSKGLVRLAKTLGKATSCDSVIKDIEFYGIKKKKEDCPIGLKNIKGRKFGLLKVIKLLGIKEGVTGDHRFRWECRCDCGNICEKSTTSLKYHDLGSKLQNSCGCENKKFHRWKNLDIDSRHYHRIKSSAKKRELDFDVTPEFLHELYHKQEGKSAISGRKIVLHRHDGVVTGLAQRPSDNKDLIASLDRIDSSKGYVQNNVWWISRRENSCKMDLDIEDLEQFFVDGHGYLTESKIIRKEIQEGKFS